MTVQVDIPAGSLPADARLTAELLGASTDADAAHTVADVAAELDEADVDYDGFVALDISFVDAAGAKIEPLQPVSVSFSLPADLLPAEADPATLAVQHLAEDETGKVETVETVADVADETDGTVTVETGAAALSLEEDAAALPADAEVKAEFEVDGFSTFTITWNASGNHSITANVNCYNVDDNSDLDTGIPNLTIATGNELRFDNENPKLQVPGYQLDHVTVSYRHPESIDLRGMLTGATGKSWERSPALPLFGIGITMCIPMNIKMITEIPITLM